MTISESLDPSCYTPNRRELEAGDIVSLWDQNISGTKWFVQDSIRLIRTNGETCPMFQNRSGEQKAGPWQSWDARFVDGDRKGEMTTRWVRAADLQNL